MKSSDVSHVILVLASWFFYGYFHPSYLIILVGSNLFNYGIAQGIYRLFCQKKPFAAKAVFLSGVGANLLLLGYFKYYDFFVDNLNLVFHSNFALKHIILPLGISFFLFQQILFLVERYRSRLAPGSLLDYLLFVSFFPQLVAGPIVTYSEIIPQLHKSGHERPDTEQLCRGLNLFVIGLFKKIMLADSLALIADAGYGLDTYGFCTAWVTAIAYSLQIYFDFSGYSDMARGLGRMFHIELPINFDAPYRSASIREFWQRWHITLGRTLRECIYIPLGGSRNGLPVFVFATMVTFFLSGLWHGAAWTFVLWGTIYGLLIVFEKLFAWQERVPFFVRRITTLLSVNFLWVLFRSETLSKAFSVYRGMFRFSHFDLQEAALLAQNFGAGQTTQLGFIVLLLLGGMLLTLAAPDSNQLDRRFHCNFLTGATCVMLFVLSVIGMTRVSNFIYFNF